MFDVSLIFIFKYLSFVLENIGHFTKNTSLGIEITLPIGISFFTFQIMSYVFDVYYGKAKVQKNVLSVALYISLFPQLIAGPIVRYETVADELNNRIENSRDFTDGMIRFVFGLGKKVLIANYVALIADNVFNMNMNDGKLAVTTAWLGVISYALQIYFDFSGYSDMAIGLGKMFGFHFDENFNYPYAAVSVTDFWRRWHISLSTWFRDYIYIPLGGNRVGKSRWVFNLFIVWLLTGIWHGANWTFVVWGLFYFILLITEKLTGFAVKLKWFSRVYTLFFVLIGWVIFRAESLSAAWVYLKIMFGNAYAFSDQLFLYYLKGGKWVLIAAVIFSFPIVPFIKTRMETNKLASYKFVSFSTEIIESIIVFAIFIISLLVCVSSTYNPFIYFNF